MQVGDLVQYTDAWDEKGNPDLGVIIRINEDTYEVYWFNDNSYMAHYFHLIKRPFNLEKENKK